jgi:hypothetical protein
VYARRHILLHVNAQRRTRTTLSLKAELYAQVKKIAAIDRRNISSVLELAIEAYTLEWKRQRKIMAREEPAPEPSEQHEVAR